MPTWLWNVLILHQYRGLSLQTCCTTSIRVVCILYVQFSLCWGCRTACFMSPHSALDCLSWQFSSEAPCFLPLFAPVLAFLLHSFYPTVDEDTATRCLSSLWQWSVLMDIPGLEDIRRVDDSMLCIQSLRGTCWSCFCCRRVVPSGNRPSPCLPEQTLDSLSDWLGTVTVETSRR